MKAEIITITPEMAKQMLGRNENNRPINWKKVDIYAGAMSRGEWKLNGETIIMNGTRLLNGQKRLWACVRSGVSFTTWVVEGVDTDAFDTMDQNEVRTKDQILHIAGIPSSRRVASGITWHAVLSAAEGKRTISSASQIINVTASEMRSFVEKYEWVGDTVNTVFMAYKRFPAMPLGPMTGLHIFLRLRNEARLDEFLDGVSTGVGLEAGDPRLALRSRLIDRNSRRDKEGLQYVAALYVYAWNAFKENRKLVKLQLRTGLDKLPAIS
jgi:hypothetical protein